MLIKLENDIDCKKIKLIIWDLDETFWDGTISEGECYVSPENIELIKNLSKRGIVNSICSKNDFDVAFSEIKKCDLHDYFVFPSIDWSPKGERVKNIITNMNLRNENVLFIDDNISNLKEVEYYNNGIMVKLPDVITMLKINLFDIGKDDDKLSRLSQYKLLEKKSKKMKMFNSNEDFLKSCNIKVYHYDNCIIEIERILELINRSNQLNFTKSRYTFDELNYIFNSSEYKCQYIKCQDNYGDYGIIGYVCLKCNEIVDFVFSCRIMGMGIEQYVFQKLNSPKIKIVGPVSSNLTEISNTINYINVDLNSESNVSKFNLLNEKILLKGPCDLQVLTSFIESSKMLDTEFNFMDSFGNQADYFNHLANVLSFNIISNTEKKRLISKYSFLSDEAFNTKLFEDNHTTYCISLLMDSTLSVYKSKLTGTILSYGMYNAPIIYSENFEKYLSKSVMTARSNFIVDELKEFSNEFELIEYDETMIATNILEISKLIGDNKKIIIMLLPELKFETINNELEGKELIHKKINNKVKELLSCNSNISFLDVNKFILKSSDYFDSINHYSKKVYYLLAEELLSLINGAENLKLSSKTKMRYQNLKRKLYKIIFLNRGK